MLRIQFQMHDGLLKGWSIVNMLSKKVEKRRLCGIYDAEIAITETSLGYLDMYKGKWRKIMWYVKWLYKLII